MHPYRSPRVHPARVTRLAPVHYLVFSVGGLVTFVLALSGAPIALAIGAVVVIGLGFIARHIYRRTPRAVRVTATAIEITYRDDSLFVIDGDEARIHLVGSDMELVGDDGVKHLLERGSFLGGQRALLIADLSQLLGYDVENPVEALLRFRRERQESTTH